MKNVKPNGLGTCFATNVAKLSKTTAEIFKKLQFIARKLKQHAYSFICITPLGLFKLIFCTLLMFVFIQLNIMPEYSVVFIILIRDYLEKYH